MTLDFSAIVPYLHMLLTGAKVTIQASFLSVLFGGPVLGIFRRRPQGGSLWPVSGP